MPDVDTVNICQTCRQKYPKTSQYWPYRDKAAQKLNYSICRECMRRYARVNRRLVRIEAVRMLSRMGWPV